MDDNQALALFKQTLINNNIYVTKVREEIFKLLINDQPQTINELTLKIAGSIDRVSLYRNIKLFEKLGIINRINIGWKYKLELSDKFIAHHHHLSCLNCGKIIDIKDEQDIEAFIKKISEQYHFKSIKHQFEIFGYCKDCDKPLKIKE